METSHEPNRYFKKIFWFYHRVRSTWPIWFYVLNREARMEWEKQKDNQNQIEKEVVDTLNKDGIAIIPFSKLFPDQKLWSELETLVTHGQSKVSKARNEVITMQEVTEKSESYFKKYKKKFLVNMLETPEDAIPLETKNPLVRLTFSEPILSIVSNYLQMLPKFRFFTLQTTLVMPKDSQAMFSQKWHRDPEDKKLIKFFIYFSDVLDATAGPFTYVKGSHLGGKWRHIFPQVPPLGSYPKEGELEKTVPKEDIQVCLGKKGTVIFCDTSGLHRGGLCTEKERIMFTGCFVSKASIHPLSFLPPTQETLATLGEKAAYTLRV